MGSTGRRLAEKRRPFRSGDPERPAGMAGDPDHLFLKSIAPVTFVTTHGIACR